jgi:phosphoribosylanthranilate isomerase
MKKIAVQIYEVQSPEEAQHLAESGVDHMGSVILSKEDWRNPQLVKAFEVARSANVKCSLIPLFSDLHTIQHVLDYYQPDIVHFCESLMDGAEIAHYCKSLVDNQQRIKQRYPQVAIMRSIPIAPAGLSRWVPTLKLGEMFEPVSDFFLTDTLLVNQEGKSEDLQPVNGFVGITGQTCDWPMAARLVQKSQIPVILAGGLSPDNVFESIVQVKPAGVDSCTGTNALDAMGKTIRFQKDWAKVRRFADETRRAQIYLDQRSGE